MIKTPHSHCRVLGSIPDQGTRSYMLQLKKIPDMASKILNASIKTSKILNASIKTSKILNASIKTSFGQINK